MQSINCDFSPIYREAFDSFTASEEPAQQSFAFESDGAIIELGAQEIILAQLLVAHGSIGEIRRAFRELTGLNASASSIIQFCQELLDFGILVNRSSIERSRAWHNPFKRPFFALCQIANPAAGLAIKARSLASVASLGMIALALTCLLNSPTQYFSAHSILRSQWSLLALYIIHVLFDECVVLSFYVAFSEHMGLRGLSHEFKPELTLGFLPRFRLSKRRVYSELNKPDRLALFGGILIIRSLIFSTSTILFYIFSGHNWGIAQFFLTISFASLIAGFISLIPFYPLEGYGFLVTAFSFDPRLYAKSLSLLKTWSALVLAGRHRDSLHLLSGRSRFLAYGLLVIVFNLLLALFFISEFGEALVNAAPEIFGAATYLAISLTLFAGFTRFAMRKKVSRPQAARNASSSLQGQRPEPGFRNKSYIKATITLIIIGIGCLPYRTNPGGVMTIVSPEQFDIFSPEDAYIKSIYVNGADSKLIKRGTLVAALFSQDIDDRLSQARHSADAAGQKVQELRANRLAIKAQLIQADSDVIRYRPLAHTSAISIQDYEEAVTKASSLRSELQSVEASIRQADANLQEIETGISDLNQRLLLLNLRMPQDGYITTANARNLKGKYYQKGESILSATTQYSGDVLVQVPTYFGDDVKNSRKFYAKLNAFPGDTFQGSVTRKNYAAFSDNTDMKPSDYIDIYGRLDVVPGIPISPGMSGYAKLEGRTMPFAYSLFRPLVRFVFVDIWSMLP